MTKMTVKEIISFSKKDVCVNFLTESNSVSPLGIVQFKNTRLFLNLKDGGEYPYKIEVLNRPEITKSIKDTNYDYKNVLTGNLSNFKIGYLILGYNLTKKTHTIYHRFWYGDTLPSTTFNNSNYKFTNPLNNLESDLDKQKTGNDILFLFMLGDSFDYVNGTNKYFRNEASPSTRKRFKVNDGVPPLLFLKNYGTKLNVSKMIGDSMNNIDADLESLSNPRDYYISYMSKIEVKSNKIVEEYFSYNTRGYDRGVWYFRANLEIGDVNDKGASPSKPFTGNYPLNTVEKKTIADGNKVLMGFNINYVFNILNHKPKLIAPTTVKIKGVDFKVNNLLEMGNVGKTGMMNFTFNTTTNIAEVKKE